MKKFFNNNKLYIIGGFIGAMFGYLYYTFIGCKSGTCAITSKPLNSIIYFALIGSLLVGLFKSEKYANK